MNNLLIEFIEGFVDFIIANPTANRGAAIDHLQTETNGVNNTEGGAWIDAMSAYTNSLGWNTSATYNNLRNKIVSAGDVTAKAFFGTIVVPMVNNPTFNTNPVVPDVTRAIRVFDLERKRQRIRDKIAFLRTARDALPTATTPSNNLEENALRGAYQDGLEVLRQERDRLDSRIEANQ